jgi:hypothetical protein
VLEYIINKGEMHMRMTQESEDKIRAAEHEFCVALDLKVDPETYDGDRCESCLIGQLAFADGLVRFERNEWGPMDIFDPDTGGVLAERELLQRVADQYGVDFDKIYDIYAGVTSDSSFDIKDTRDVQEAKRKVVAAYMDCTFE